MVICQRCRHRSESGLGYLANDPSLIAQHGSRLVHPVMEREGPGRLFRCVRIVVKQDVPPGEVADGIAGDHLAQRRYASGMRRTGDELGKEWGYPRLVQIKSVLRQLVAARAEFGAVTTRAGFSHWHGGPYAEAIAGV